MHRLQLVIVSLLLLAQPLGAQVRPDTAAGFRRGQWGAEFIPGSTLATGGVLRFSTPTRAWVLDASASLNHQTNSATGTVDLTGSSVGVSARLGPRWYHAEFERVMRFVGLGVTGS